MFITIFLLIFSMIQGAEASPSQPASVGIVDTDYVMQNSLAAKQLIEAIEKRESECHKEALKIEAELMEMRKQLEEEQKRLSQRDFAQKRRQFEKHIFDLQQRKQDQKMEINYVRGKGINSIKKKIKEIVGVLRRQQGMSAVLPAAFVIDSEDTQDLTQMVTTQLNKELNTLDIDQLFKDYALERSKLQDIDTLPW